MNDGRTGAWVGIDAGKESHWAHMLDASGIQLLSRKVENDEAELVALIEEILSLAQNVVWAIDQPGGSAALLLALLCGSVLRGLFTYPASPWTEPATPTAESPRPTPKTPTS
jgi:Transposase